MVAVANCNESWIMSNLHVARLLLDNSQWIVVDSGVYEFQAQLVVCMSQTAPTVSMKALSSSRKEFQLSLMSRT